MDTINLTTTYCIHCCSSCGVLYAITDAFEDRRRDDGKTFYCPNGHGQSYRDTLHVRLRKAEEKLAREQARHDQTRAALDHTEARRRAAKGQLTKVKNRVAKGVCPCCNRSFADLAAHMATKHPEYAATETT